MLGALLAASLRSTAESRSDAISFFPNGTGNTVMFAPFLERSTSALPSTFLSFNFDWNLNRSEGDAWTNASYGWTLDLQSPELIVLASSLAPANLRVGGSNADKAVYNEEFPGGIECDSDVLASKVCLSPGRWDELIGFADKTGLRLIFDLNLMIGRNGGGKWDPTNAHALLNYTAAKYPRFKHGFELGNEKEFVVSAADTASCYLKLRAMINKLWPEPEHRPILVGPELNPRPDWLETFLDALGAPGVIDAVAYHMYVGYGRSLNLPHLMMEPGWLDFSHKVSTQMRMARDRSVGGRDAELWIGETAAAWASGTAGVCDGFISGFWWLDQLGMAASTGHSAMCRQCLVGGNYSLIDQLNGFAPNPDYWTAWIWRQLVGESMLAISQVMPYMGDFHPQARAYMACTREGAPGHKPGAVTLVFLNQDPVQNKSILMYQQDRMMDQMVAMGGLGGGAAEGRDVGVVPGKWGPTPPPFPNLPRQDFVLTPHSSATDPTERLLARQMELNGKLLERSSGCSLPSLAGHEATAEAFVVPPQSYGFAVYSDANAPACQSQ